MNRQVLAYIRADDGDFDQLKTELRRFAEANNLDILEEYAEQGRAGEAFSAVFRRLSKDTEHKCGLLIPSLFVLGSSRREVRGRMAGLRELGVPIYEVEGSMLITWTTRPADEPAARKLRERNA